MQHLKASLLATLLAVSPLGLMAASEQAEAACPKPIKLSEPAYPEEARRTGSEGLVTIECLVAADGSIVGLSAEAAGTDPLLKRAALAAAQDWKFAPLADSAAGYALVRVPVQFQLSPAPLPMTTADIAKR